MATDVPAALKAADISRFASRAAQVEKAKPAIAFWSYYWIVQQIITRSLQNGDDECRTYTSGVMDKLEAAKADRPDDDAITDDVAGKAFVEQFGLEVFQRADNAVRANKASRQTADTFLAAATFLELLQIWPPLDGEIAAKIKFAKYHAIRIAKAIKAGEDPNLSNPPPEPAPGEDQDAMDVDAGLRQPTVEDVPDEQHRLQQSMARTSSLDQSLHPSRAPSLPRPAPVDTAPSATAPGAAESFYQGAANGEVSPLGPPSSGPVGSPGGGYFPQPSHPAIPSPPILPPAPSNDAGALGGARVQPPASYPPPSSTSAQPPHIPPQVPGEALQAPGSYSQGYGSYGASHVQAPLNIDVGEEAIAKAQKHARWAISALNFDDVPTAISELRGALEALGTR